MLFDVQQYATRFMVGFLVCGATGIGTVFRTSVWYYPTPCASVVRVQIQCRSNEVEFSCMIMDATSYRREYMTGYMGTYGYAKLHGDIWYAVSM